MEVEAPDDRAAGRGVGEGGPIALLSRLPRFSFLASLFCRSIIASIVSGLCNPEPCRGLTGVCGMPDAFPCEEVLDLGWRGGWSSTPSVADPTRSSGSEDEIDSVVRNSRIWEECRWRSSLVIPRCLRSWPMGESGAPRFSSAWPIAECRPCLRRGRRQKRENREAK